MYYCKEVHLWIASEITWKPTTTDIKIDTLNKTLINTTLSHNPSSSPITNTLHYILNAIPPQPLTTLAIQLHLTTNCAPDPSDPNGE